MGNRCQRRNGLQFCRTDADRVSKILPLPYYGGAGRNGDLDIRGEVQVREGYSRSGSDEADVLYRCEEFRLVL